MELEFINYIFKDSAINLTIPKGIILGITGENITPMLSLIAFENINKGQAKSDGELITKDNVNEIRKKISFVKKNDTTFIETTTLSYMKNFIKTYKLELKDPNKKIKDSLKIVGLPEYVLNMNPQELSFSEKHLLRIAASLLSNPTLIILEEPFKCLDKFNEKRLIMLLTRLKDQYKKTIIIATSDSNILYKYTNEMVLIKNNQLFLTGPTKEVYERVDYLKRNKFEIPDSVEFTYLAKKKKQVKIDYHRDVRDIIKDIYKHI